MLLADERHARRKEAERFAVNHFLELMPLGFAASLVDSEEPDFLIVGDRHTIGLEVTEIHGQVSPSCVAPKATEALKRRCVLRAQALCQKRNVPPLHVSVHFNYVHVSKAREPTLAAEIAALVQLHVPSSDEICEVENDWASEQEILPKEVASIRIYNLPNATRPHFNAPGASWVADLSLEDVQRAISAKNAKAARYRTKAVELWLLLSCNGFSMSTWFEIPEGARNFRVETSFDRVFLVSHFGNRVVELGVRCEEA